MHFLCKTSIENNCDTMCYTFEYNVICGNDAVKYALPKKKI